MGSWTEAIAGAGLTPRADGRVATRRWTADACWEALRAVVDEAGEIPTYGRMTGSHPVGSTSVDSATVRNRLGRWRHGDHAARPGRGAAARAGAGRRAVALSVYARSARVRPTGAGENRPRSG